MLKSAILGYPRIGEKRELKKATEDYWKGRISSAELQAAAKEIRKRNWLFLKSAGIDFIPSNDFSFYDSMLDMTALLGAVPPRYGWKKGPVHLDTYFNMARGSGKVTAMEMTKWFDTNYHYLVPEFHQKQKFAVSSSKPVDEFKEALAFGVRTRPVLIGPVTFLSLGKEKDRGFSRWKLLKPLLKTYAAVLEELKNAGADAIQIDEPALALDLDGNQKKAFRESYAAFAKIPGLSLTVASYFGGFRDNLHLAASLPVAGLHVDLVRAPGELRSLVRALPKDRVLSLGVIDGRNIWKTDLVAALKLVKSVIQKRGAGNCAIASACSLMHSPLDLSLETSLNSEIKHWLAFAKEKVKEVRVLQLAVSEGEKSVTAELRSNHADIESRRKSKTIHRKEVIARMRRVSARDFARKSTFKARQRLQQESLRLPLFPTTTIGSFPQTPDVRQARADFKKGALSGEKYDAFLREKTGEAIRRQEAIGFDVLVHGEFERNDMVEYFGERLDGFTFTQNGWVQSYGTRCVKPPVIYGDVSRPRPMTVEWTRFAQSLTSRPVKGMLTGPITILQWSFVRDDQPRSTTAKQIALAIRDEVGDLEKAGTHVIQIDEPALREGLPLRKKDRPAYLKWAVDTFRLAAAGVADTTQIHTHMCYSEFNDIIRAIAAMDADVISIETSRSQMELLDAFVKFRYPNEIGPGVYDIHSPRIPSAGEMKTLLEKAAKFIPIRNLWVNPDCGLKTRGWEETLPSLQAMTAAARALREKSGQ